MLQTLLFSVAVYAAPAAADAHEELLKDILKVITEVCDVMDKVKDKATAEQNKAKLKELAARMDELRKQAEKLGPPGAELQKKLAEEYLPQFMKLEPRMLAVRKNLEKPEIKAVLGDINLNPK